MASEAIHDYRAHSRSPAPQSQPLNYTASSSSGSFRDITSPDDKISRGGDEKDRCKLTAFEATFEDARSSSEDDGDDEAAWKLDEMVEQQLATSSFAAPKATATSDSVELDTSAAMSKKQDDAIRNIVRMAGPPPQPTHRLPCPVIIPQRRPGNKSRGFVRAYAPVMEGCGVKQDIFLKFQDDWVTASKVILLHSSYTDFSVMES